MKGKVAIAFVVLIATACLVVLMSVSPDRDEAIKTLQAVPLEQTPVQPASAQATPRNSQPVAEPGPAAPTPEKVEEDLAAMEERIRSSVDRLPAWDRFKFWWYGESRRMSEDDYEKSRGLYLRFLDNYARIKTARFHVDTYQILEDGSERLLRTEEVVWSPSGRWHEFTGSHGGKSEMMVVVCDGETRSVWRDGQLVGREPVLKGIPVQAEMYMFSLERALIGERTPQFLNHYTTCDLDNGSMGYSRLWNPEGAEARFETSTGLLTEERRGGGGGDTYTYQNVGAIWFVQESVSDYGTERRRQVFSEVVLNEPVDESLFDVNRGF